MFYDTYTSYIKLYKRGLKHIKHRSFWPVFDENGKLVGRKASVMNYDLFFNRKGNLISSVEDGAAKHLFTCLYYYDKFNRIESIEKFIDYSNTPHTSSSFDYYPDGKLMSELVIVPDDLETGDRVDFLVYRYQDKEKTIYWASSDEVICETLEKYTAENLLAEYKFSRDAELVTWDKMSYNLNGELIERISLDEMGKPDYRETNFEYYRGECTRYLCESNRGLYTRNYMYQWNDKGDWIEKMALNDDKPIFIYTREMEYYIE